MASFLSSTNKISAALEDLIKHAQDDIILISPYVKVNQKLQDFIRDADGRGVKIMLIYGKSDMKPDEWNWIKDLTNREVGFVRNLHAKCYISESTAIISSMNLYDFSQQNNDEMGILVQRDGDADLYDEILDEVNRLGRLAELQALGTPKRPTASKQSTVRTRTPVRRVAESSLAYKASGRCIRCREPIDIDPDKPLCGQCYQIWVRYADYDYAERYCHRCGKENATSMAKPLCVPCFRQVDK